MKNKIAIIFFYFLLLSLTIGCEKEEIENLDEKKIEVQQANEILKGDIVLSTVAKMGGIDKTLLSEGCPTKYYFEWLEDEKKILVKLPKFQVGTMPFAIAFKAKATYTKISYFKKDEYPPEDGWLQFKADDGVTYPYMPDGKEPPLPDGAGLVEGFINIKTHEIEMLINYNVMVVTSHCFRQKIDKSRLATFDEDFKKYEANLKKHKEEHGY